MTDTAPPPYKADLFAYEGDYRSHMFLWAAGIVQDPSDAAAVTSAVTALKDWAEQAASEEDLWDRMDALHEQHRHAGRHTGDVPEFIRQASVYYEFTAQAGEPS